MKIGRLGNGGSDYAAFVQHVGIPSTNMAFGEGSALLVTNSNEFIISIFSSLMERHGL
jgi:N-acetylated-alpha-linked acidic dipeptidase